MNVTHSFVLPHWLYWGALLLFPLVYIALAGWREHRHAAEEGITAADLDDQAGAKSRILASIPGNRFTRAVDALSQFTGVFVAYWTVIAVLVYFFEVVSRYFLRMPTNWAHESMFLMFGMQYLLAGAYAYLHDAHVRVDLFYAKASPRGQAAIDIVTHFFFLVFALAFIWTAWTFFASAMDQNRWPWASGYADEVSFTEWAVAYWPVKFTLVLGGVLLLLQGLARLVKDIQVFTMDGGEGAHG
ncbi:TRAP transporter small permease subunit [Azospirillum sp. ST 5-10]|uniref:TRAP transporter small permease subunit n=1 Tax=unclassified Azospirillum TaxID=2630922 RepID=UPI003F4A4129